MTEQPNSKMALAESNSNLPYWICYGIISIITFSITIFTKPTRYADLDTYVFYLDSLVHFPSKSSVYFELFSNVYLISSYWITNSVLSAVILAHYCLAIIFVAFLATAFPSKQSSWIALPFMFAILGPLLAFVTLRATPAYFLVAIAVRYAMDRRPSTWFFLIAASLFHISSLLAALPIAILYFEPYLPNILRTNKPRKFYIFMVLIIFAAGGVLPQLSGSVTSLIQSIPLVSKYDVYTDINSSPTQIGHYIFLAFLTVLTILYLIIKDDESERLSIFVLTSFSIYILLFFSSSPVAAFRQAPFWLMAMIATIPWNKLGIRNFTAVVFVFGCAGLFVFQFNQVYY